MYLGLILFPAGAGRAFGSWLGMALPLLMTFLFAWRIGDEEKLLHPEFGESWEACARRTRRLVPFVYSLDSLLQLIEHLPDLVLPLGLRGRQQPEDNAEVLSVILTICESAR